MPSVSSPQHRLMEGIAHGMKSNSGKGPSVSVAKDFVAADKRAGKKFSPAKAKAKADALRKPPRQRLMPGNEGMEGEEGAL